MQSYCIYAEAFAGPFRPLRAPEPPFTHKTPPFTQVLFLFDAFYGTISLRRPSSLCSYKTESEAPMKKRILALLLAFSMMLSLLPVSALADTGGGIDFAAYASNGLIGGTPDLVMDNDGRPDLSSATQDSEGVYQGNGWRYVPQDSARKDKDTLYLDGASFNLSGASIWCNVVVSPRTTVENARFNYHGNPSGFPSVTNNGILQSCMFIECYITNNATIQKSTIEDCSITNDATIRDSLFSINSSATLLFKFEKSGSITDSVFDFNPTTYGLTLNVHSLQASPIKALDISTASNPITYLYLRSNVFYTIGYPKIKVYCYNPDNPTGGSYKVCSINGVPAKSYDPDFGYANDSYIFTVQDEDVELSSSETTAPALEMDYNGWPKTDNMTSYNGVYYGDGWKYENSTLTLKSGKYDFTYTKPSDATSQRSPDTVRCNIVVEEDAVITGGKFSGDTFSNSGTVKDVLIIDGRITNKGTLSCLLDPLADGTGFTRRTMTDIAGDKIIYTVNQGLSTGTVCQLEFTGTPKFTVKLENSDIHCINGRINYGGLKKEPDSDYYTFTPPKEEDIVLNDTIIHEPFTMTNGYPTASNGGKTACKGEGWEYILGDPEHGDFLFLSNAQIDFSKISDGSPVECKLFIGHGVAVQGGTFNGDVINNGGGILGGTFNGAVENHGTIKNGVFNGAVENHGTIENGVFNGAVTNIAPGTVSNSITGTGTLNGKPITPNAYTLTVTGGGLVNGKPSAVVEAGDEVRLTVGEGQDGMSFNYWDLPTALIKALMDKDSTFSNKVESLTFTMPDLSEYTEDKSFTIRLDIRPAELPDDDDGPSVLGTMATVAVGGAAAGILVWQGVSLGVDSYLQLSLPGGVPVPTNRRELVKLLWETAGKPDVVLPALYGDVSTEDAELQKATRWAIDNGLVKPADDSDASRFDPDRSVSKYEVARAWFKVQQMLK